MKGWEIQRSRTRRQMWRWARLVGGAAILSFLLLRLGTGPFLLGLRRIDATALATSVAITALTTVASAWRWRLIAQGLGLRLPLASAVASYYRSQFLNSTLPGGVVGDFHRGLRVGEDAEDVSAGLRSVVWDRAAGQVVQTLLAVATLLALTSPVRPALAAIAGSMVVLGALAVLVVLTLAHRGRSWPSLLAGTVRDDLRAALATKRAWPAVFLASSIVVAGHVGVFLVAARTEGSAASIQTLLPIAVLVQLAMTVPTSIGGWGPREGVAVWAFSMAGLGAGAGLATATLYGVLSLGATLPGAVVLIVLAGRGRRRRRPVVALPPERVVGQLVGTAGRAHG